MLHPGRFAGSLIGVMTLAPGAGFALEPDELFVRVSPSVVEIHGFDTRIKPATYGSGVVIARETVITNCHVLAKTRSIIVKKGNAHHQATLEYPDVERDLCQLKVPDLNAPAVTLGSSQSLRVGQRVYALGNPIGLELTLSDGLISAFRKMEGSAVPRLQTSAPISPGSSGGGLFDRDGNLIGITTAGAPGAENIAIAHPVEWVRELPERGREALALRDQKTSAAAVAVPASPYPRQLNGDELLAHFQTAGRRNVQEPKDTELVFRPGGKVVVTRVTWQDPTGYRTEGTYRVSSQDRVCVNLYINYHASAFTPFVDCFNLVQTDQKTYQLRSVSDKFVVTYVIE